MKTRKDDLLRLCGSMEQIASVRPVTYLDGRAAGLRCIQITSGPLEVALMQDKCLDPAWIRYKGMNLSYLSKPGLQGRNQYDTNGAESGRSIMAGAMMTCGFEHIHGSIELDGKGYPSHGRMRSSPAEKVSMDGHFVGDDYEITVAGEVREAEIFGENLVLRRQIQTRLSKPEIRFTDTVENQTFRAEPFCFLYHCNAGYPLMAPGSRVILPSLSCTPRDTDAERGVAWWARMGAPRDNAPEQVFMHRCAADKDGNTFGAFVNDKLEIALCLRWNVKQAPYLAQWKSEASGDYVMALEPTNTGFDGRAGDCPTLSPLETYRIDLTFQVIEGAYYIRELEQECKKLLGGNQK